MAERRQNLILWGASASIDLGTWLHWFATDVIMEITFGKRLGFLEQGEDVNGILKQIEDRFSYVAVVRIGL